jgi:hypothetical protein
MFIIYNFLQEISAGRHFKLVQVVEHLPSKHEALSSNPSIIKEKKRKLQKHSYVLFNVITKKKKDLYSNTVSNEAKVMLVIYD